MPRVNGVQVVERLRFFIRGLEQKHEGLRIREPKFVFMSAFRSISLTNHLKGLKIEEFYEKPL